MTLGIFDSDQLEFDTENLREQAMVIQGLANDLENAQNSLRNNLTQLRDDWKTAAGEEFFKKFDDDWVKLLDDHIEMLRALTVALQNAIDAYDPLATEYSNINLEG